MSRCGVFFNDSLHWFWVPLRGAGNEGLLSHGPGGDHRGGTVGPLFLVPHLLPFREDPIAAAKQSIRTIRQLDALLDRLDLKLSKAHRRDRMRLQSSVWFWTFSSGDHEYFRFRHVSSRLDGGKGVGLASHPATDAGDD